MHAWRSGVSASCQAGAADSALRQSGCGHYTVSMSTVSMSMPGCEARCGVSGVRRVRGLSMLCVVWHLSYRGREPSACGVPQSFAKDCSQNLRGCDGHACAALARHVCKYARVHVNSAMCTWAMARAAAQHGCAGADSGKTQRNCTRTTKAAAAAKDGTPTRARAMRGVGRVRGDYCICRPQGTSNVRGGLLPGLSWRPLRPHCAQAVPANILRCNSLAHTRRHTARADVTL